MKFIIIAFCILNTSFAGHGFTCDPDSDCNVGDPSNHPMRVPDPNDCTKFYRCKEDPDNEGMYVALEPPLQCPDGSFFDVNSESYTCETGSCTESSCNTPNVEVCKTSCGELDADEGVIAFPGDCTKYYHCFYSSVYETMLMDTMNCEEGQVFTGEKCESASEAEACCNICGIPVCSDGLEVPHREDCSSFYYCTLEIPIMQICPDGESFDIKGNICMESENAICGNYCSDPSTDSNEAEMIDSDAVEPTDSISGAYTADDAEPETTDDDEKDVACTDVNTFVCEYDQSYFPLCEGMCDPGYIECSNLTGVLIAHRMACSPGEFLFSKGEVMRCLPLELCEDMHK